jgi:hypothetical protein
MLAGQIKNASGCGVRIELTTCRGGLFSSDQLKPTALIAYDEGRRFQSTSIKFAFRRVAQSVSAQLALDKQTPALDGGLTHHVWTVKELIEKAACHGQS